MQEHQNADPKKTEHPPPSTLTTYTEQSLSLNTRPAQTIMQLQRLVGNQAVQRLFVPQLRQGASVSILQRADFGLAEAATASQNFSEASALWLDDDAQSTLVKDVIKDKSNDANNDLEANGTPRVKFELGSIGAEGHFDSEKWTIRISSQHANKTLADLHTGEYADLVASIYHEARHAEQTFLVARWLAGQGIGAIGIKDELDVPREIAQAAKANPLSATADKELLEQIEVWHKFIGENGIYHEYTGLVNLLKNDVWTVYNEKLEQMYVLFDNGNLGQDFEQLRDSVDATLNSWSQQTMKDVQTELSAVEAIKNKTDVDKQVHHDLKKIKEVLDGLLAKWDGGKLTKDPQALFADEVGSLPFRVKSLLKALKYAYWNLPHEADAYQVGGLVGNMINLSRRQQ